MRPDRPHPNPLFRVAGTLLALHAVLWATSALGVLWSRPLVAVLWLAATGVVGWSITPTLRSALRPLLRFPPPLTTLSLAVGAAAFGALALASWQSWNVHPDWVFHWGPKAQRFALAQGIDLDYLTRPWNAHVHPDYPNLLPNLTASLALALEGDHAMATPRLGAIVTLVFAALWFAALRTLALRLLSKRGPRWVAEAAWLTAAWSVTMFGTGFQQAAGGDLPFGCVVTLGALALATPREDLRRDGLAADLRVGLVAALASQVKFEGSVFALVLITLWILRRAIGSWQSTDDTRPKDLAASLAAASVLPALFVAAWVLWNRHHGLFLPSNAGALDLGRVGVVARGLLSAASERAWHWLPFVLLALPWLGVQRATRWPALLVAGQFGAYVFVYLTTPVDLDLLLLTSASRLLYHLVPTVLVLAILAADTGRESDQSSETASLTSSDEPVSPTFLA